MVQRWEMSNKNTLKLKQTVEHLLPHGQQWWMWIWNVINVKSGHTKILFCWSQEFYSL